jgi:diacylglycerol O-acyltransferase / wax synthase
MRALSPTDELFLFLERPHQPMHVAGLAIFEPVGDPADTVHALLDRYRTFGEAVSPFDERVVLTPLGYCFVRDRRFALEDHLRRAALPAPGGKAELCSWVATVHESALHRERALWETRVVEGLSGGRFALYQRVHHAVLDGVSALRRGLRAYSPDPTVCDLPPVWAVPPKDADEPRARSPLAEVAAQLKRDVGDQLRSLPTLAREATRLVKSATSQMIHGTLPRGHGRFGARITSARRFGMARYPQERFQRLGRALGGTLNDAVLAVCAGGVRGYLAECGTLPDEPLHAMVPVALRTGERERGNRVAMLLADLATDVADGEARVARVLGSVRAAKERYAPMSNEEIVGLNALMLTPTFLSLVSGLGERACAFQVVISNVPGPKERLYLDGSRLVGTYPVSIIVDHVPLNITFTSYDGELCFGVIACSQAVPSVERLLAHFHDSLRELEALSGIVHHGGPAEEDPW